MKERADALAILLLAHLLAYRFKLFLSFEPFSFNIVYFDLMQKCIETTPQPKRATWMDTMSGWDQLRPLIRRLSPSHQSAIASFVAHHGKRNNR